VTSKRASKTAPAQPDQQTHPVSWCDPTRCQADADMAGDRRHSFESAGIELSLLDRWMAWDGERYSQTVSVVVDQDVTAAAPTLSLYSETAGHVRNGGFDLDMTRDEFIALHAAMGRAIEATA
jgi:hypothetical protein